MTGYERFEKEDKFLGKVIWELRSLNHRYLDISIYVPKNLLFLEPLIREKLKKQITRGKIECFLYFKKDHDLKKSFTLNKKLVKKLVNSVEWISNKIHKNTSKSINLFDILKWPNVLKNETFEQNIIKNNFLNLLKNTITNFINFRKIEGKKIKLIIQNHLLKITKKIKKIEIRFPKILALKKTSLLKEIKNLKIKLEENRIEQEILFLINRISIEEELERLKFHIKNVNSCLLEKKAVGKKLDFLMQEFNREANTITSKSIDSIITHYAIEIKVLISEMREHIQNIE